MSWQPLVCDVHGDGTESSTGHRRAAAPTKRQAITFKSLKKYGAIIVVRGMVEALQLANIIAPEHVELIVRQPEKWARGIRNAGAIFLGPYSRRLWAIISPDPIMCFRRAAARASFHR